MKILLTNDDGYNSTGITILKKLLEKNNDVIIVAPKNQMSGKSVSVTRNNLELVKECENVYSFDGTPADCVNIALKTFGMIFDLVVSGCNNGWNTSYNTLLSGTVGACMQAGIYSMKSVCFSCQYNFEIVEQYFNQVWDFILKNKLLSNKYVLNVNFPLGGEVKGIKIAKEFYPKYPKGKPTSADEYFSIFMSQIKDAKDKNSDAFLIHHSFVSIVPLNISYTNNELFDLLKNKISK